MSQAQISAKKTRFAPKISSDIRSAAGELFIGPSQSLPEMSDGPTAIGEHCPNPKKAFIFPISSILVLIFPFLWYIFPNVKEKVASQNR